MKTIPAVSLAAAAAFSSLAAPDVAVRMGAFPENETPAFTQGAIVEVVVSNASGRAISGEVALRVAHWDGRFMETSLPDPGRDAPTARPKSSWFPGELRRLSLPTADLAPDGYVLTVVSVAGNGGSPNRKRSRQGTARRRGGCPPARADGQALRLRPQQGRCRLRPPLRS